MARISTYIKDTNITGNDFVIGSDGDNTNRTSQFSVDALATYINRNVSRVFATDISYGYNPSIFQPDGINFVTLASDKVAYEYYFGIFLADGSVARPAAPPVFRIEHGLKDSAVNIVWLQEAEYQRPAGLWVPGEDGDNTLDFDTSTFNTPSPVEDVLQITPLTAYNIIDEDTVDVTLGGYGQYRGTLIVTSS